MDLEQADTNLANQIVVFGVASGRYGIRVDRVREMTSLGHLDEIAGAPPWIAGVIRIREEILPVVDLRLRLGMPQLETERSDLAESLAEARSWHSEQVEALVEPAGATHRTHESPRHCRDELFSHRIYDEIPRLRQLAERAKESHEVLHAAMDGTRTGDDETDSVEEALTTWKSEVDDLLRQLKEGTRPMVIVVSVDDASSCIQVDRVHSVVSFGDDQIESAPLGTLLTTDGDELVSQVVKTPNDPRVIQILDVDRLLAAAPRVGD